MGAIGLGLVASQNNANAATMIDNNHVLVEKNDTLSDIAKDFGTDVDALVRNNNIADKNLIHVGDKLVIDLPNVQENAVNTITSNSTQLTNNNTSNIDGNQNTSTTTAINSAKEWIAQCESGGSYTAQNGQYIGKYQLSASYLNGDYSPANQEKVANEYAMSRYGSWENAMAFWQAHNWW